MSSLYEDKEECCEFGLSGDLTQVNSEELEFEYLFNYEPRESDFPSGDLKGLFSLISLPLLMCLCVCVLVFMDVQYRMDVIAVSLECSCSADCASALDRASRIWSVL